jgi:hypothetical protein
MADAAHGESLDHDVYRTPFAVQPEFDYWKTPDNYRDHHIGEAKLPDKMKVWRVQNTEEGNSGGVVSRAYGFEDSPDAEAIALGFNWGKEYGAVGIGRHGNILQWGYIGLPAQMTEAGRKLFLNCICYIHRFDGQRPIVHTTSSHRLNAIRLALLIDQIENKSFFSYAFTPELMQEYKGNPKGLADYYRQNLEFIYRDPHRHLTYQIDSDLKDLGLESNRTVETLGKLIQLLRDRRQAKKAARLLSRYTDESRSSPDQWQQWFDQNKDRIFFSDVGGYKFFVVPEGYPIGQRNQTAIGQALFR